MNPTLITLCGMAQLVILFSQSRWIEGLALGAAVTALLTVFSFTRLRWDGHVDMFLAMIGPGGLGMLLGGLASGISCHEAGFNWRGFLWMSAGMALASLPLCWFRARCILEARGQGYGLAALLLDLTGMQMGMMLGYLPLALMSFVLIPSIDMRAVWLHHGIMLIGMSLGMLVAAAVQNVWRPSGLRSSGSRVTASN